MYLPTVALLLAASGVKATAVLAARVAPASNIVGRDVAQGWSLQSSSAVSGTTSCGNGAYCPSSLHCNTAANDEVAACCSSSSDCRGDVEGSPKCADDSWSLWSGYDGNGFCCEVGMVGAYDIGKTVAGTCVASGAVGSLQTAVLTSTGSGAASTSAAASSSTSASSTSSASVTSAASSASSSASEASKSSESSASTSSKAGAKTTASSTTGSTSSGASSTGSATSSSSSAAATGNGAEKVGMGFGLIGAAFLAVAAL